MLLEPTTKRTIAFIDGQNLFHMVREAFGYSFPNYDPGQLALTIAATQHWQLDAVRYYTGVPALGDQCVAGGMLGLRFQT